MGRISMIIKLATVAGPTVFKVVKTFGPQLRALKDSNPEVFNRLTERVAALAKVGKGNPRSAAHIEKRIGVLRDQVTYLYASANTPAVAAKASAWRTELDAIEHGLPVLEAMTPKLRKARLKEIDARVNELSEVILVATFDDEIEDAEVVDDEGFESEPKQD